MSEPKNWRDRIPTPDGEPFRLCAGFPALPGLWDLSKSPEVISHWTGILRGNARYVLRVLDDEGQSEQRQQASRALEIVAGLLADLETDAAATGVRTIHEVTLLRDHLMRSHGLIDPYQGIKAREARRLLPAAAAATARAWEWGGRSGSLDGLASVLAGLLAGNLFDLGSAMTQKAFRDGALDVAGERERFEKHAADHLKTMDADALELLRADPRPLEGEVEGRVLLFADNAGADFLLGVLPAALFWARRWEVCVVVNSLPVSSDIAIEEARALLSLLNSTSDSVVDQAVRAGRLRLVESGTGSPGIDFRFVGETLNQVADGASWILLDGQGRAVETNWETRFRCPVLRVAAIKDALVAREIGVLPGGPLIRWDWPGG
jgi:type II pantothenate kinase